MAEKNYLNLVQSTDTTPLSESKHSNFRLSHIEASIITKLFHDNLGVMGTNEVYAQVHNQVPDIMSLEQFKLLNEPDKKNLLLNITPLIIQHRLLSPSQKMELKVITETYQNQFQLTLVKNISFESTSQDIPGMTFNEEENLHKVYDRYYKLIKNSKSLPSEFKHYSPTEYHHHLPTDQHQKIILETAKKLSNSAHTLARQTYQTHQRAQVASNHQENLHVQGINPLSAGFDIKTSTKTNFKVNTPENTADESSQMNTLQQKLMQSAMIKNELASDKRKDQPKTEEKEEEIPSQGQDPSAIDKTEQSVNFTHPLKKGLSFTAKSAIIGGIIGGGIIGSSTLAGVIRLMP